MASSSVSQESLDRDDAYEFPAAARRSRISRPLRSRGSSAAAVHKSESLDSGDQNGYDMSGGGGGGSGGGGGGDSYKDSSGGAPVGGGAGGPPAAGLAGLTGATAADHDSPTRSSSAAGGGGGGGGVVGGTSASSRAKDRDKRARPNHLHKGKTAKDKRKLREKRRSTGVVHLPSTESTGDSLDEEEGDKLTGETKRNTSYNEVIDADNPQTPEEYYGHHLTPNQPLPLVPFASASVSLSRGYNRAVRNKSPSDLEADLEDNQDYDSTVSQSETNLTIIGQSTPQCAAPGAAGSSASRLPGSLRSRMSPDSSSSSSRQTHAHHHHYHHHAASREERDFARPVSYPSRFRDGDKETDAPAGVGSRALLGGKSREGAHHAARDSNYSHYRSERAAAAAASASAADGHSETRNTAEVLKLKARNSELERMLESEREEKRRLLRQIEQERDEKSRLRQMLDSRDVQISELQGELQLLGADFDLCCEDNEKLQQENAALVRAFSELRTT